MGISSVPTKGFLREGITLESLLREARGLTDAEAARQVRLAREALMDDVCAEVRGFRDVWSYARGDAA